MATEMNSSVLLWPNGAPQAKGAEITDQPALTIHLPPDNKATGAAIVVCPGGGFSKLALDNEGLHVAQWLNSVGVAAFVLRYRLRPNYEPSVAVLDAQRAIRYVRYSAKTYNLDSGRIGILGFSAGGHLATESAIRYDTGNPEAIDPIDCESSRPNFTVPIYPVIDEELPNVVTPASPPAFLVSTGGDLTSRIKSNLAFYEALLDNQVSAEMHVFGSGKHGSGLAPGDPSMGQWSMLLVNWLRTSSFLTDKQRFAINGTVTIDGKPLSWGGVAFIPEDSNAPSTWVFSSGKLNIDAINGPVPGPHRVEVHVLSKNISDMTKGKYSMDGSECYTTMVDVQAGKEIDIAISREFEDIVCADKGSV